ncbi:MAG TPA: DUF664 domain-containing protein [Streptosporangiaceae bacterium]|jgi:hypothetical protein|nr:DUF664 domain-containing protein [Streptosporangiaceae bacterium]
MTEPDEQGISGPPTAGDEAATLLGSLERQRATFAWKVGGLDEKGLAAKVGASALTPGGLIKHLAFVEDLKFTTMLLGQDLVAPWNAVDWENDAGWPWHSAAEDSPGTLYRLWHDAVARPRASVARAMTQGGLDVRIKYGSATIQTTRSASGGCSWTSSRSTRGTSVTPT